MNNGEKIVIFYSNPRDTPRLRLDKEHSALDAVMQRNGVDADTIVRKHATTIDDIIATLADRRYSIIQFSGHGTQSGFVLEDPQQAKPITLAPNQMRELLGNSETRAVLLLSCFSHAVLSELIQVAPFVITIDGAADDQVVIDFCAAFYDSFFKAASIERAFSDARRIVAAKGGALTAILTRRGQETEGVTLLYQVYPNDRGDSVLVDMSASESDIDRLGIDKDEFVKALTKKMRIHKWLFVTGKHRAIIPIGPYFGVFSWPDTIDVVSCHNVLKVKISISEPALFAWASLIVSYNDLFVHRYRLSSNRIIPNHQGLIRQALDSFWALFRVFFATEPKASNLRDLSPGPFLACKAMIQAHLEICDEKWSQGDYDMAVVYLETVLTTIHEFVSSLVKVVTE